LQQDGVRSNQVKQVRGYADQLLRVKTNPYDPSNRRISILVKNIDGQTPALPAARKEPSPPAPTAGAKPAAAGSAQSKPPTTAPAAKTGLLDKLKGMMPGKKS